MECILPAWTRITGAHIAKDCKGGNERGDFCKVNIDTHFCNVVKINNFVILSISDTSQSPKDEFEDDEDFMNVIQSKSTE